MVEPQPSLPAGQSLCDECQSDPWKYRCPGCSIRTCSLPCVKSHKHRTGCSGQKSHSEVVPLSSFDDNLLIADYNFLEEAKRMTEAARRGLYAIGGRFSNLPIYLKILKDAARRRRTQMLFLPYGMSRREKNRSRYNTRNKTIFWTIEWRFHSTDVVLIDHGVDEHTSMHSVIGKHLIPGPWNHQLRPFCIEEIDRLKFFLQMNKGSRPIFRELRVRDPIGQQMDGVLLVEYPVIHVYLPTDTCEFEVEKSTRPAYCNGKPPSPAPEHVPSIKGTFFREEEIDDDGSSDTVVVDLMQCARPTTLRNSSNAKETETAVTETAPKRSNEVPEFVPGTQNSNLDFEFEQDLKDAYTDLVREVNPDDFLCFDYCIGEGGHIEICEAAPFIFNDDSEKLQLEDGELEEGEIPS